MYNKITMYDLWKKLKQTEKPILLYGMGNGADKIIKVLEENGIKYDGVFASDGFVRDKLFHGFKLMSYSEAREKFGDFITLLCFGSDREDVRKTVLKIAQETELYAPDVPVYGDILFNLDYAENHRKELEVTYNLLADEISKKTFENTVKYKITGDISYLLDCEVDEDEPYRSFLKLNNDEVFADLGAYRGDTVEDFLKRVENYRFIYAVEPDYRTYQKLLRATEGLKKFKAVNACISDTDGEVGFNMSASRGSFISESGNKMMSVTVDGLLKGKSPTLIKMDIEGAELSAIKGAENTILNHKPKMVISCYHKSEDLITLPNAVNSIRNDYKIYMRHFKSFPAWDSCFYLI